MASGLPEFKEARFGVGRFLKQDTENNNHNFKKEDKLEFINN